jgi:CPA2 family monovalent cation:H+ antiporter-2
VTFADIHAALRVLAHIHALNPAVPVIVRARDEADISRLSEAGATEVVPEAFESGVMLASHTMVVAGVPLSRVMRRVSQVREQQYSLLRGLFPGGSDAQADSVTRLHAVTLDPGAYAIGRELYEIGFNQGEVQVRAVRRPSARLRLTATEAGVLQAGDIVVLLGAPERLLAAEEKLLRG